MSVAAASPMSAPLMTNATTMSRGTSMPRWTAARALAPRTSRRVPNDVRENTRCTRPQMSSASRTPAWIRVPNRSGRSASWGIDSVCGTACAPSNGPMTRIWAMLIPMNDIIRVVTISLMPWRAFSHAGMSVHAPPTTIAMSDRTTQPTGTGTIDMIHGPRPATNAPASRNCPSMPRFQRPARNTTMSPAADDEDRHGAQDRVGAGPTPARPRPGRCRGRRRWRRDRGARG